MDKHPEKPEEGIMFLDLLILLLKRKKLIVVTTMAFGIVAALVSLILPNVYRAETVFLPPSPSVAGTLAQSLSSLGNIPGFVAQGIGAKSSMELYIEILTSRSLLDRIVDRFDLMRDMKAKYREDARKTLLKKRLTIDGDKKSGLVTVKVDDRDPKRAAGMANAFIEELKRKTGGLAITEAAQRRRFFKSN